MWCLHLLPHTTAPRSVSLPGAVLLDRSSADVAGWEGRTKLIDQAETSRFGYSCLKRSGLFGGVRSVFPTPVLDLSLYHVVAVLPTVHPPACTIVFCLQQGKAQWTIYAISWIISYCNVLCSSPQHQQCTTASFPCHAGDIYNSVGKNPFHWPGCSNIYSQGSTSDRGEDVTMGHMAHHLAFQTSSWQSQGC